MRTVHRVLAAVGAAAVITTGLATTAVAEEQAGGDTTLTAEYRGEVISLDEALAAGAAACSQQEVSTEVEFRCYEDAAGFRAGEGMTDPTTDAGTLDKSDCRRGYLCLWDNRNYAGAMVDFNKPGHYFLQSFKDRANSAYSRRPTASGLIDTDDGAGHLIVPAGYSYWDMGALTTNWNNKTDELVLVAP